MMRTIFNKVKWALLCVWVFLGSAAMAQVTITPIAHSAPETNAAPTLDELSELYKRSPDSAYSRYLSMLIDAKKYKVAEAVVQERMNRKINNNMYGRDAFLHIDLGNTYAYEKKYDKATQQYDSLLMIINGDDLLTQHVVRAFQDAGNEEYAILAYEKTAQILNAPFLYNLPLARLYDKCGEISESIDMLLVPYPGQGVNLENVKSLMLELMGSDSTKLALTQKALFRKINEDPGNAYYAELLTWIYTQKNDWDGALMQMEAVDERNKEGGKRLIDLAHLALAAKQYEIADKAYDNVIAQGKEAPFYMAAMSEQLHTTFEVIKNDSVINMNAVNDLAKRYDTFLAQYPRLYSSTAAADFAELQAHYAGNAPRAIEILQKALSRPDTRREVAGRFKLQMGDYYVLSGSLWEASLTYSQVDKEFKQDILGEDARFRNAKLAYYRGDFVWAQRQLSVLKASTSELIANDALYLSVLITENVEDSNYYPLERFAYAGQLMFQNKDAEAGTLLDSINKAFPKHPLNDDIIMLRAEIALKHHDYNKALGYLKTIYEKYKEDVLGDDAVFKMAEIYQNNMHQPEQARHYYEQLIIDYPGSTYVQTARQRLAQINNGLLP